MPELVGVERLAVDGAIVHMSRWLHAHGIVLESETIARWGFVTGDNRL